MWNNNTIQRRQRSSSPIHSYLSRIFLQEKLNNWVGLVLCILLGSVMAYLMVFQYLIGIGITAMAFGLGIVLICILNTEAGLYINMIYSFFAFHISRWLFYDQLQVGVITDVLVLSTFLSFLIKRVGLRSNFNKFAHTPVAIALLILYSYTAIQLFNPYAHSFDGWYQGFRKSIETLLLLFISYNVFDSLARIKRFIKVLFILCTIAGIYGCIQQWHGLFPFELNWVTSDPHKFGLYFIQGDFRKFSTMSDPAAYAIAMAAACIFFVILTYTQKELKKKLVLLGGGLFMFLGMLYSGTRTANGMLIAGFALFILLTINQKATRIFAVIAVLAFIAILYGPFYSPTVIRFRTTFSGKEDASFNVREQNRKSIQPYIYTHPIGGGIGTTGATGMALNPGHTLAGFETDSGLLKKALELGSIGLTIFLVIYFLVLRTGIRGYFRCTSKNTKLIYAAVTCAIFSFYVADYAQVAIGQITDIVIYYPFIAIILKLKNFDETEHLPALTTQDQQAINTV